MNIGQAAARSGLNSKTIRYYESIELVTPRRQPDNGYRDYSEENVRQLGFLRNARRVGFNLAECRELLALYCDPERRSAQVKELVMGHVQQLEAQMASLTAMRQTLMTMAEHCPGDNDSECAIIDGLAEASEAAMPFMLIEQKG